MSQDTSTLDYWLNWRFALCAIWVLCPMVIAAMMIWKNEGPTRQSETGKAGIVYSDESWRPCFKSMHPAWLLAFRVVSFFVLLTLLILNLVVDGPATLYYYTQWTFFLVTMYFALGSVLSIHGCRQYLHGHGAERAGLILSSDTEQGAHYIPPTLNGFSYPISDSDAEQQKGTNCVHEMNYTRKIAGFWGYLFQIIYQTNAGAVMITDCVFWLVILPFRAMQDYDLDWMLVGMHSVNVVFLIGDIALNSLRFPWFRIAYFLLFTGIFVIFQWIVHASVSMWWPYPFLDLSSPLSPVWYLIVALLHLPCYAILPLIMKMKHSVLSRCFPHSYDYRR
ncbi:hypothetical protein LUZ60_009760 [Juncus effusus]|nr:hypothetical protein LUZ60_009760 [Juncus effusus]